MAAQPDVVRDRHIQAQVQAQPQAHSGDGKSSSRTVTDTIIGEHEHTIVGYSLVKGIGDGEPIASERFSVGGHEWVLLFYPDGKKSSSTEGHLAPPGLPAPAGGNGGANQQGGGQGQVLHLPIPPGPIPNGGRAQGPPQGQQQPPQQQQQPQPQQQQQQPVQNLVYPPQHVQQQQMQPARREATNDYSALFVALIGESDAPQGVVNTSDGRVVRAFHRFTLVDQTGQGRDLTKGRRRDQVNEQGAVKISCARQDPNARNCHGYRKFVKRSVLENPQNGFMANDTIVIRYTIELVVSSGGALSAHKTPSNLAKPSVIQVPPPSLGHDMAQLLESGQAADVRFKVEEEELAAHKFILTARSPVFRALLNAPMREGQEGDVDIKDVRKPVFQALLYFTYTDQLPEELEGSNLDCAMAQHLLVAADRFQLPRLRRICERRLCETVEVDTVATTLTLAEQNHAEELKRVCLEFASRNLSTVMCSEGYHHMITSCPQLQAELLHTIAVANNDRTQHRSDRERGRHGPHVHPRDHNPEDEARRVRPRRE